MAKESKEVPPHIKEYYTRGKKIAKLLENTKAVHSQAYLSAAEALKEAGESEFDLERLEEVKYQDKFLDRMVDHYLTHAVQRLGLKSKPKDEWEQDILLQRYLGVTRAQLRRELRGMKSGYNLEHHEKKRDKLLEHQAEELAPLQAGHLENKHIGDILGYVGAKKHFRPEFQDYIKDVAQVVPLLDIYKGKGEAISVSDLNQLGEKLGFSKAFYTDATQKELENIKKKRKAI